LKGGWRFPFVGFMPLMVIDFVIIFVLLTTRNEKCWNTSTKAYDIETRIISNEFKF
jgi:hypothetical protein